MIYNFIFIISLSFISPDLSIHSRDTLFFCLYFVDNNHHSGGGGSGGGEHHVRFDENLKNDDFISDNSVQLHQMGVKGLAVHLGFLQMNHRYLVELKLPLQYLEGSKIDFGRPDLGLVQHDEAVPNLNCRLTELVGVRNGQLELKLTYLAHKEKLLKETLVLANEKCKEQQLRLIVSARVLGRGKGTPMLRDGVHLMEIVADEESDASDWIGFSKNDTDEL